MVVATFDIESSVIAVRGTVLRSGKTWNAAEVVIVFDALSAALTDQLRRAFSWQRLARH